MLNWSCKEAEFEETGGKVEGNGNQCYHWFALYTKYSGSDSKDET